MGSLEIDNSRLNIYKGYNYPFIDFITVLSVPECAIIIKPFVIQGYAKLDKDN